MGKQHQIIGAALLQQLGMAELGAALLQQLGMAELDALVLPQSGSKQVSGTAAPLPIRSCLSPIGSKHLQHSSRCS